MRWSAGLAKQVAARFRLNAAGPCRPATLPIAVPHYRIRVAVEGGYRSLILGRGQGERCRTRRTDRRSRPSVSGELLVFNSKSSSGSPEGVGCRSAEGEPPGIVCRCRCLAAVPQRSAGWPCGWRGRRRSCWDRTTLTRTRPAPRDQSIAAGGLRIIEADRCRVSAGALRRTALSFVPCSISASQRLQRTVSGRGQLQPFQHRAFFEDRPVGWLARSAKPCTTPAADPFWRPCGARRLVPGGKGDGRRRPACRTGRPS